jgi:hypothetical protein
MKGIINNIYFFRDIPFYNNQSAYYVSDEGGHVIINASAPINIVDGAPGNNYFMPDEICNIYFFKIFFRSSIRFYRFSISCI